MSDPTSEITKKHTEIISAIIAGSILAVGVGVVLFNGIKDYQSLVDQKVIYSVKEVPDNNAEKFKAGTDRALLCAKWELANTKTENNGLNKQELFHCTSDKGFFIERSTAVSKNNESIKRLAFLTEVQNGTNIELTKIAVANDVSFIWTSIIGEKLMSSLGLVKLNLFEKVWNVPEGKNKG